MWYFSRFTDPGWRRVAASPSSGDLRISAFISPDNNYMSIIVINTGSSSIDLSLSVGEFSTTSSAVYQTSEQEKAADIGSFDESVPLTLPGRSITTISLGGDPQGTPRPTGTPTPTPTPGPTDVPVDCTNVAEWDPDAIYETEGMRIVYNGKVYENKWYTSGQNPEEYSDEYEVWTLLGPCDSVTPSPTPTSTPGTITRGDVNEDDSIDIIDALVTAQYYVGLIDRFC